MRRSRDGGARLASQSPNRIFKRVKKKYYQHVVVNSMLLENVSVLWYSAASRFCNGLSQEFGGLTDRSAVEQNRTGEDAVIVVGSLRTERSSQASEAAAGA